MLERTNCLNCGAPLNIEPGQRKVFCSHCGTEHFSENAGSGPDFVIRGGILRKYTGESTHIKVPESVKKIANGAFAGCIIDELILPDSLETLELEDEYENIWEDGENSTDCRFSHLTMPARLDVFPHDEYMDNLKSIAFNDVAFLTQKEVCWRNSGWDKDYYAHDTFTGLEEAHFPKMSHLHNLLIRRIGLDITNIRDCVRHNRLLSCGMFNKTCRIFIEEQEVTEDNILDYATDGIGLSYAEDDQSIWVTDAFFLAYVHPKLYTAAIARADAMRVELYDGFLYDRSISKEYSRKEEERARKAEEQEQRERQRRETIHRGFCPACGSKLKKLGFFGRRKFHDDNLYCKNCGQSFLSSD